MLLDFLLFEKNGLNCIKFSVKNEIKCAMTCEMLTVVFDKSTMSRSQVQLRYDRFKGGQKYVQCDVCTDRPGTSTTDENIEYNFG